ncbi:MAG: hypothetical protein ACKVQQ_19750, partial [Burkholderiales bacterium]
LPSGASTGGNEPWTWVTANPAPYSGTHAHQSTLAAGMHQHHFSFASTAWVVGVGESLFTYIYLDPTNPPTQVMLQINDGTDWEQRAYWGANQINWGVNGTVSRRYIGPLPATGQWVRLEVPAAQIGMEGRAVRGIAFALSNGRATWDRFGRLSP